MPRQQGCAAQASSLGFSTDESLVDIARDLRFKLADHGIEPEDLRYTGHGYANLLHSDNGGRIAKGNRCRSYALPVAADHKGPAGQLQVIVATHSPNLSAWVSSKEHRFLEIRRCFGAKCNTDSAAKRSRGSFGCIFYRRSE